MAPDTLDEAQRPALDAAAEAQRAAPAARRAADELQLQVQPWQHGDEDVAADIGRGGDGIGTGEARG